MSRERHLMPAHQRAERVLQKRRVLLRFLREEIWTDHRNLGELLGVNPAATYRTIAALEKMEIIRVGRIPIVGGQVALVGITHHGQGLAADPCDQIVEKVFTPSRISATYLRHTLDTQLLRIKAERVG